MLHNTKVIFVFPLAHKLIVSRHVLFDEQRFPISFSGSHSRLICTLSSSSTTFESFVVHPNTFSHLVVVPIPFPQVFSSPNSGNVTCLVNQSNLATTNNTSDLVYPQASTSSPSTEQPFNYTELNPDTSTSQVDNLQLVLVSNLNCHPMQTRSKSGYCEEKHSLHNSSSY